MTNLLLGIRVIVFDFDGVIVDSEGAKRAAWHGLLKTTKDQNGFSWKNLDHDVLIKEAHRVWIDGTAKGSRFEIIEHMMDAAGYPKSKEMIDWYAEAYNRLVQEAVLAAGIAPETHKTLETLSRRYPLYLNSGTPEEALRESADALGIHALFKDVLGKTSEKRDKSKVRNIEIAAQREGAAIDATLFVGDAVSDYKAALEAKCRFIRFTGFDAEQKNWDEGNPPEIQTLAELIPESGQSNGA